MEWMDVHVECYEGHRSREVPRRLIMEDNNIEIIEIIDRWYEGGIRPGTVVLNYFKVRGGDGKDSPGRFQGLVD